MYRNKKQNLFVLTLCFGILVNYGFGQNSYDINDKLLVNDNTLTKQTVEYLLSEEYSFDEKRQELSNWVEQSSKWLSEGRYQHALDLSKALEIAVPRLEIIRQLMTVKLNIQTANHYTQDIEGNMISDPNMQRAETLIDVTERLLLSDGTQSKHLEARENIRQATLLVNQYLDTKVNEGPITVTVENEKGEQQKIEVGVEKEKQEIYVVKLIPENRDSLWKIASYKFIYDDPWKWPRIFEANRDKIKDPDLIHPGQKLVIPPMMKK